MNAELEDLQRQLDKLTQQNYQDTEIMRSVAADLTAKAYLIEAVHQMLDAIGPRTMHLAQRIAGMIPSSQTPPQINEDRETRAFVGRVARHSQDDEIGSDDDLARIISNLQRNRPAAE
jgi:hypothetical protein